MFKFLNVVMYKEKPSKSTKSDSKSKSRTDKPKTQHPPTGTTHGAATHQP